MQMEPGLLHRSEMLFSNRISESFVSRCGFVWGRGMGVGWGDGVLTSDPPTSLGIFNTCCPPLQLFPKHRELEMKRGRQCKGVSMLGGIELGRTWALRDVGMDVTEIYRTLITKEPENAKQTQLQKVRRPQGTCCWCTTKDEIISVGIG